MIVRKCPFKADKSACCGRPHACIYLPQPLPAAGASRAGGSSPSLGATPPAKEGLGLGLDKAERREALADDAGAEGAAGEAGAGGGVSGKASASAGATGSTAALEPAFPWRLVEFPEASFKGLEWL